MSRLAQPSSLLELALEAFGWYMYDVGSSLMLLTSAEQPLFREELKQNIEAAEETCKKLRQLLQGTITPTLANCVTKTVLSKVDALYSKARTSKLPFETLASSFVHPATTELNLSEYSFGLSVDLCHLDKMVALKLNKMKDLRYESLLIRGLQAMSCLRCLEFHSCTDRIMAALGEHCPLLTHLDVSLSEQTTDLSIMSILKLQCLRAVNLMDTCISKDGLTYLLLGFIQGGQSQDIYSFGCNNISTPQLKLLVEHFYQLSKLHLMSWNRSCDDTLLYRLTYLTSFQLHECHMFQLGDLMLVHGDRLEELYLDSIESIDLSLILRHCRTLKSFTLATMYFPSFSVAEDDAPALLSLEYLHLKMTKNLADVALFLAGCPSLRTVRLDIAMEEIGASFVHIILLHNSMRFLEKLILCTLVRVLPYKALEILLNSCCSLKFLQLSGSIRENETPEFIVNKVKELFPGLKLDLRLRYI